MSPGGTKILSCFIVVPDYAIGDLQSTLMGWRCILLTIPNVGGAAVLGWLGKKGLCECEEPGLAQKQHPFHSPSVQKKRDVLG